jgi:hypothetical protein
MLDRGDITCKEWNIHKQTKHEGKLQSPAVSDHGNHDRTTKLGLRLSVSNAECNTHSYTSTLNITNRFKEDPESSLSTSSTVVILTSHHSVADMDSLNVPTDKQDAMSPPTLSIQPPTPPEGESTLVASLVSPSALRSPRVAADGLLSPEAVPPPPAKSINRSPRVEANMPLPPEAIPLPPDVDITTSRENSSEATLVDSSTLALALEIYSGPDLLDHDPLATLDGGMRLYRLCDTVPFLLGPAEYIAACKRLTLFGTPRVKTISDDKGNPVFDKTVLSTKDKTVLMVLELASRPQNELLDLTRRWLQPLVKHDGAILCWKYLGDGQTEQMTLDIKLFARYLRDWQHTTEFFDPGPVDNASRVARWASILDAIHAHDIDIQLIDRTLFNTLLNIPTPAAIARKLTELSICAQAGLLTIPSPPLPLPKPRNPEPPPTAVFHYNQPQTHDESRVYGVRFSHKHPLGERIDFHAKLPYDPEAALQQRKVIHIDEGEGVGGVSVGVHDSCWDRHSGRNYCVEDF